MSKLPCIVLLVMTCMVQSCAMLSPERYPVINRGTVSQVGEDRLGYSNQGRASTGMKYAKVQCIKCERDFFKLHQGDELTLGGEHWKVRSISPARLRLRLRRRQ